MDSENLTRTVDAYPPDQDTVDRVLGGSHHNPHGVLGAHPVTDGTVVRVRPHADEVAVLVGGDPERAYPLVRVHDAGLWSGVGEQPGDYRLRVRYGDDVHTVDDPYRWLPTLGEIDLHLIGEAPRAAVGRPRRARPQLRHIERAGQRHELRRVGARGPGCASRATSTGGQAGPIRCGAGQLGGVGDLRAERGGRQPLQVPSSDLTACGGRSPTRWRSRRRSRRRRRRSSPRCTTNGVTRSGSSSARSAPAQGADERLRGPRRLVAAGSELPGGRAPARRLPGRDRVHARRAAARCRAPVRRLVGLPGHLVLRADRPVRHAGRLPLLRGHAAPGRLRNHRRLGAGALPEGRLRLGTVRRHPAVRARRPPPRRAAGLGHVRLRLRSARGAQLPRRERPVLAGRVPRGRAARRRGGIDALPGLLATGRAVAAQHLRRPGRTSTPSRSCRR